MSLLKTVASRVTGIVLYYDGTRPTFFSTDSQTPNAAFGLYSNLTSTEWHVWNPNGSSLMYSDIGFPIFGLLPVTAAYSQAIGTIEAAVAFNKGRGYSHYPLYGLQFDALMYGALEASTCLRRGFCSPVGGNSVWSTYSTNISANDGKPVIVVAAKMDSAALIHDYAYGASELTGLVAMLGVAEALGRVTSSSLSSLSSNIVFAAFNAETWSFAGSQRFVKDLVTPFSCTSTSSDSTTKCPMTGAACSDPCFISTNFTSISFNSIQSIVEFGTVGGFGLSSLQSGVNYYLHVDSVFSGTTSLRNSFADSFTAPAFNGSSSVPVTISAASVGSTNNRLPPSSAMSFLQQRNIPAVYISDYQNSFSNSFYNSEWDDGSQWNSNNVAALCGLINSTAYHLYQLAGGSASNAASISVNCTLVNLFFMFVLRLNLMDLIYWVCHLQVGALLDCFTRNISCSLLSNFNLGDPQPSTQSTYPSVYQPGGVGIIPYSVFNLLFNWTAANGASNLPCATTAACVNGYPGYACVANKCLFSMTNYHRAFGTGLEYNGGKNVYGVTNGALGSWTESQ